MQVFEKTNNQQQNIWLPITCSEQYLIIDYFGIVHW